MSIMFVVDEKRFFYLIRLHKLFKNKAISNEGFCTEFALAKAWANCDTPKSFFRVFIRELVDNKVLFFNSVGNLVIDKDKFNEVFWGCECGREMRDIFEDDCVFLLR